jgi:hypothetical protein
MIGQIQFHITELNIGNLQNGCNKMLKGFTLLIMVYGEIGVLEDQRKDGLTRKIGIE